MVNAPFSVQALYPYESDVEGDLTFNAGQVIKVTVIEDEEWYSGSYTDTKTGQLKTGMFPQNFVEAVTPSLSKDVTPAPVQTQEEDDFTEVDEIPTASQGFQKSSASPTQASGSIKPSAVNIPDNSASVNVPPQSLGSSQGETTSKKRFSFQDRIAAFNTSSSDAAAPSPFSQPKPATYAKKTFYATPSNSYVPQIPSIPKSNVKSPPLPPQVPASEIVHYNDHNDSEEEQQAMMKVPLKERIKLLQQQQQAEAARAEAALAKKKNKAPKPRKPSEEQLEAVDMGSIKSPLTNASTGASLNRRDSLDSHFELDSTQTGGSLKSMPTGDDQQGHQTSAPLLASVQESDVAPSSLPTRRSIDSSKNMGEQISESQNYGDEEEEEEDEDDEEDEEEAKRLALRERMAKISGGMGMHLGMVMPGGFGMPGGGGDRKPKKKAIEEEVPEQPRQAPIPILPFALPPGASNPLAANKISDPSDAEEDEEDESTLPVASSQTQQQPRAIPPPAPTSGVNPGKSEGIATSPLPPPHANRELISILDAHKEKPESEDSDSAWSDANNTPTFETTQPNTAPVPPVRANSTKRSSFGGLPEIPTSPILDSTYFDATKKERTRSKTSKRESLNLSSLKQSLPPDYDEVVDDELGDDERTESEDNRLTSDVGLPFSTPPSLPSARSRPEVSSIDTKANRLSYVSGSGAIPPVPMSPSNTSGPLSPRGPPPPPPGASSISSPKSLSKAHTFSVGSPPSARPPVPTHGRTLSRSSTFEPTSPPPKPPIPAPLSAEPRRIDEEPSQSSEEVTGYDADEDTDMNNTISVDEEGVDNQMSMYTEASSPPVSMARTSVLRSPSQRAPPPPPPTGISPGRTPQQMERGAPPPPPQTAPRPDPAVAMSQPGLPSLARSSTGGSMSQRFSRTSIDMTGGRRSIEQSNTGGSGMSYGGNSHRLSMDTTGGNVSATTLEGNQTQAVEFNLQPETQWWLNTNGVPPGVVSRKDVVYEVDETETWKRGGRSFIVRDIYILFPDYSQTIITVEFSKLTGYVSFQQRIEAPPPMLRQDQLEAVYGTYGRKIAEISQQIAGQSVPLGNFLPTVLGKIPGSLPSVGNRSYGALLYHNLANSSVRQYDEIRPGDIAVFRSSKFQGHKGSLHQKYTAEAGRLDVTHVGIVYEWDGAKRKIRIFEQPENGSAGGKIKPESYRLNDLKSGEVKVFRVIGRDYVGWD